MFKTDDKINEIITEIDVTLILNMKKIVLNKILKKINEIKK